MTACSKFCARGPTKGVLGFFLLQVLPTDGPQGLRGWSNKKASYARSKLSSRTGQTSFAFAEFRVVPSYLGDGGVGHWSRPMRLGYIYIYIYSAHHEHREFGALDIFRSRKHACSMSSSLWETSPARPRGLHVGSPQTWICLIKEV